MKKPTKVKGWVYGVAAFLFFILAACGGTDVTTEMPNRSQVNSVVEMNELPTEKSAENEVSEFEDGLLVGAVESSQIIESYEEKSIESSDTKENEVKLSEEGGTTEQSKDIYSDEVVDSAMEESKAQIEETLSSKIDISIVESAPVADNSSPGVYAVNGKNGKIHIVGDCSATGNGDNAMSNPVYFVTYEEAEAYSISIKSSLKKRRCGNCWR